MNKKIIVTTVIIFFIVIATPIGWYYWNNNTGNLGEDDLSDRVPAEQTFPPPNCNTLLNNSVPLKDKQVFLDTEYTGVTITSRESWDKSQLPQQITDLESKDYTCYPMPFETDYGKEIPGMHVQPEVKSVEWSCELEYEDYEYIERDREGEKNKLIKAGYNCEKQNCEENDMTENYTWLCTK